MKKIFVSSWFFPPINSAEGIVTFKLLKRSKFRYDVFTHNRDDNYTFVQDSKLTSKNINVISSDDLNPKLWVDKGFKYFCDHHTEYSCMTSRCMPGESHELALKIKRKFKNVFWIASFSDPLAYNPYTKLIEEKNPYKNKNKDFRLIIKNLVWNLRRIKYRIFSDPEIKNRKIQKKTLKKADIIIFNNDYQRDYMLSKYKNIKIANKIQLLHHSYDLDLYEDSNKFYKDKIVLSFLGHLDEYRNAHCFLEAVKLLKDKHKDINSKLEIRFYGNICNNDKLFIFDNKLFDFVKVFEPVTYLESLKVMKKSNYLLCIDADLKQYLDRNIFFASKVVDYIGSESNIFCITMKDSAVNKILKEYGAIVTNFDVQLIYKELEDIVNNKRKNSKHIPLKYLSNTFVANKFDDIIKRSGVEV